MDSIIMFVLAELVAAFGGTIFVLEGAELAASQVSRLIFNSEAEVRG